MRRLGLRVAASLGSLLCVAASAAESGAEVFVKLTLGAPPAYVQGAVPLTVQVVSDTKLYQARVDLADSPDLRVQRVGKDVSSQETVNGRRYQLITRHYALLPQRSGEIALDGPVLDAEVADAKDTADPILNSLFSQLQISGGLGAMQPLRVHGDPIRLVVQPRPSDIGGTDWLPAQQMTLEDRWPASGEAVAAGQPVTRHLRLTAVGLSASQLPDLSTLLALPPGVKAYPGEPTLADDMQDGRVVGRREQDVALIADRAGSFELPALRVPWWNAADQQPGEAVLPAHTLVVTGGGTSAAAPPAARPSTAPRTAVAASAVEPAVTAPRGDATSVSAWVGVSAAMALLWLGTLGAWVWTRRRGPRPDSASPVQPSTAPALSEATARRTLLQACRDHDPRAARQAVLAWGRATGPQQASIGIHALARRLGDPALTDALHELERACLGPAAWKGDALARAWPNRQGRSAAAKPADELPGLYGESGA